MLKEKVFFQDGLPVNIYAAKVEECPIHFHDEMEIVYVLAGSVILKNGYYTYTLRGGEIFILNDREIHSLYETDEENMVVFFQVSLAFFSAYFANLKNNFFVADMKDEEDEGLEALRMDILKVMAEVMKQEKDYEQKVVAYTKDILTCLLDDFLYFSLDNGKFINDTANKGNKVLAERLRRITNYMYENYSRKLTLTEIADNEHLNVYYLSHVIRESSGMNFQELLNFIRVEESEKLLLDTSKKISAVASESGFSAVRYYIKYFQKWFGVHPSEYRDEYTSKVRSVKSPAKYKVCDREEVQSVIKEKMPDAYLHFYEDQIFYNHAHSVNLGEIVRNGQVYQVSLDFRQKGGKGDLHQDDMAQLCKEVEDKVKKVLYGDMDETAN